MNEQIISKLQQYQGEINKLSQEAENEQAAVNQKRVAIEQLRGAFGAMWELAKEAGLVNEEGQITVPETETVTAEVVEE